MNATGEELELLIQKRMKQLKIIEAHPLYQDAQSKGYPDTKNRALFLDARIKKLRRHQKRL